MAHITFLAADGCLFSGVAGLVDAFTIANLWQRTLHPEAPEPLFRTRIVTADGRPVTANGGIPVCPEGPMEAAAATDLIVIPPFLPVADPLPGAAGPLRDWLEGHHRRGTRIAALCTGVFSLAATGLLDGRRATTNWQYTRAFRRRFPRVRLQPDRILTQDEGLICGGAASSYLNLGLHVIALFGSEALAAVCAKALLVDPSRESQAPYVISDFPKGHGDADVLRAQVWMEAHYDRPIGIDEAARQARLSPRHFKRRFKQATGEPPLGYLQRVRLEAAKDLLERTRESVNAITWRIGYEDSSTFRRLFRRSTGLSPREYREKFARAAR